MSAELAARLDDAARHAQAVAQLAEPLTLAQAYDVQAASLARRLARGERRSGVKMGFTSVAKMRQMGLSDLIWGRLTDAMALADGDTLDLRHFVHPRIEPEIAFVLGRELRGGAGPAEALAAVAAVAPALEVIDSRYRDFRFSLTDVVADNASSAAYVLGPAVAPCELANRGMVMSFDGRVVQVGSSAAILGHPLRSLLAAARMSEAAGERLQPGWVVLAGGATAAEALRPGLAVRLDVQGLGSVTLRVCA